MRRQIGIAARRLLAPAANLLDTTALLLTSPRMAARRFLGDRAGLGLAAVYFAATFSAAVVLNKVAFAALGIEQVAEVPYWILHAGIILLIAAVAGALGMILRTAPPAAFLTAALLAYGASLLAGGFVAAGASLTLLALRKVGYIPAFEQDLASFDNFEDIGMLAYHACLRGESMLFSILYNGMGGAHEALPAPIDSLSYAQPVLYVAASFLFASLMFLGTHRRRFGAATAAILGNVVVFTALLVGLAVYARHLHAATPCSEKAIEAARVMTAEDQVRIMAADLAKRAKADKGAITLDGIEARGRSVIVRFRIAEHPAGPATAAAFVDRFRRGNLAEFCNATSGTDAYMRKLGMKRVFVFRYADTELTETVVQSADHCTR